MGEAQQDAETICDLKTAMGEAILDLDQKDRRIADLKQRLADAKALLVRFADYDNGYKWVQLGIDAVIFLAKKEN